MITSEQIQNIASTIEKSGVSETTVTLLRENFQGIHFTYCMDDDLPNNNPVLEHEAFNLYLVDGREHCLCMTENYEVATGVVVAEIIPE